jgi:N utilization substance protein B
VDRNIIRLAVSELTGKSDIPVRVVMDEAIELAKKYGGEESGTFVNGILDRIRMDLELEP